MTDDFEINQLRSEIDQVRSMIPVPEYGLFISGQEEGVVRLKGQDDAQSVGATDFVFRSATDSNVVIRVSQETSTVNDEAVTVNYVTIGTYYI